MSEQPAPEVSPPVCCGDHPLYYSSALEVKDDAAKLHAHLRKVLALAQRYCDLGAQLVAVGNDLTAALFGTRGFFDAPGLTAALDILASGQRASEYAGAPSSDDTRAQKDPGALPAKDLSTLSEALTAASLSHEMLFSQLKSIVVDPLRQVVEDPKGLASVPGLYSDLISSSYALYGSLLNNMRPGIGAGSRPRAADLQRAGQSASSAAKGAALSTARGVSGIFSKLINSGGGPPRAARQASREAPVDKSSGTEAASTSGSAEESASTNASALLSAAASLADEAASAAVAAAGAAGVAMPSLDVLQSWESAVPGDDGRAPAERLAEGQRAFTQSRVQFELVAMQVRRCDPRLPPSAHSSPSAAAQAVARARGALLEQVRNAYYAHYTHLNHGATTLKAVESAVESLDLHATAAASDVALREDWAGGVLRGLATPKAGPDTSPGLPFTPVPLLRFWPGSAAPPPGLCALSSGGDSAAVATPAMAAVAAGASAGVVHAGVVYIVVDTGLGRVWRLHWAELAGGVLFLFRLNMRAPDEPVYAHDAGKASPKLTRPDGLDALTVRRRRVPVPEVADHVDLLTASAKALPSSSSLPFAFELRRPQSVLTLQAPSAADRDAWLRHIQAGVHARLGEQLRGGRAAGSGGSGSGRGSPEPFGGGSGGPPEMVTSGPAHAAAEASTADAGGDSEDVARDALLAALTVCRCDDCNASPADWCSINLSLVLCQDCAGCHRSLGTHISKVRSLSLDRIDIRSLLLLTWARSLGSGVPSISPQPQSLVEEALAAAAAVPPPEAHQQPWGPNVVYEVRAPASLLAPRSYARRGAHTARPFPAPPQARVPESVTKPTMESPREQKELWIRLKYDMREFIMAPAPAAAAAPAEAEVEDARSLCACAYAECIASSLTPVRSLLLARRLVAVGRRGDLLTAMRLIASGGVTAPDVSEAVAASEGAGQDTLAEYLRQNSRLPRG